MAFEDYLSRTGYKRQFLDTNPVMGGAATPANPSATGREDLTNRLLQIMSGQLGGTLSGGEKLSALGALLKSVSRGSQTSPQDVVRGIQQQKMAEVQGALQIQELRKAASQEAQRQLLREDLLAKASTDEERARIRILSGENLEKYALQRLENKPPEMEAKRKQFEEYYKIYDEQGPAAASTYWKLVAPGQMVGSIETGLKIVETPEPPKRGVSASATEAVGTGAPTSTGIGVRDLTAPQPKQIAPDTNRIPQIATGLSAIQDLRNLSQQPFSTGKQAGNLSETPLFGSLLGQNRANLEGSIEILRGIIIQDQLARLAKLNPAGIASLANSPSEQERFVSAIANLDPNQDREQFLIGLKRAEEYLKRQKKEAEAAPTKPSGQKTPSTRGIKILSVKPRN